MERTPHAIAWELRLAEAPTVDTCVTTTEEISPKEQSEAPKTTPLKAWHKLQLRGGGSVADLAVYCDCN